MCPTNPARLDILNGWKEIANYLGKGVRSVQRYERDLGLPVHRISGRSASAVLASKAELDRWINITRVRINERTTHKSADQVNKLGVDFLQVDSEIALTFSGMAFETNDKEKKIRATQTARRAYESIMRLRKKIEFTQAQRERLNANLQRLEAELKSLGESL